MGITYSTIDRVAFDLVPEVGHLPYAFIRSIIQKHLNAARVELLKVAFADCDIKPKSEEEQNHDHTDNDSGGCQFFEFTK